MEAINQDPARTLGKYAILDEIGQGGFGIVYKARDTVLRRVVALKVLHPQLMVDAKSVRLFSQEAGTAASLEHEGIVTVYDTDVYEGRRYIAMRYLPGPSLAHRLREEGAQPIEQVVDWMEQVALALDFAHGEGVVHRDLKPSNMLLDAAGRVVVTDFGLARAVEVSGGITSGHESGIMTGTARYMAPEQARHGKATPQSDIYSLGIVTYELLTGRVPFEEGDAFAIAYQHIHEPPPPPRQFRPDLPEQVEEVILAALQKDPDARPQTAGEYAGDLIEALRIATAERQREEEIAGLYALLQGQEDSGDWPNAAATAERLESLQPGYLDVPQRLAVAQQHLEEQREAERRRLAEEQQQQRLEGLYEKLQSAEEAGTWASAIQLARQLEEEAPGYRDVSNRLAHAQARQRQQEEEERARQAEEQRLQGLATLYGALQRQEENEDWLAVIGLARQILSEAPGHSDASERLKRAEREYGKAQAKRDKELRRQYKERGRGSLAWQRGLLIVMVVLVALGGGFWLAEILLPSVPDHNPAATPVATRTPRPTFTLPALPTSTPPPTTAVPTPTSPPTDAQTAPSTVVVIVTNTPTPTVSPSVTPSATSTPTATPPPSATPTRRSPSSVPPPQVSDTPTPVSVVKRDTGLTGRIAFSVRDPGSGQYTLYSIKPDGSDQRFLGNHLRQPSIRQDGKYIIANGQGGGTDDLWTIDPTTGRQFDPRGHLDDERPVWLQSRAYHVAFDSLRWGDGQWRVYLGDAPISYGSGSIRGRYPVALPGEQLVYSGCNYGFGNGSRCGLFRVSMWGGTPIQITEDPNDIPTGGGQTGVLFMRQVEGNWDVYLVGAGGGNPQPLTSDPARDGLATFSPDGQTIAFLSDRSGTWALWLMNRDGTNERKIYNLAGDYGAEWTSERISWGPLPAVPTPGPTPIGGEKLAPPTFIWPRAEDPINATKPYDVQWTWDVRPLRENEGFEVRLRTSLNSAPGALAAPVMGTSLGVTFAYSPIYQGVGYYYLDVVVVQIEPRKELSRPAGPIRIKLEDS